MSKNTLLITSLVFIAAMVRLLAMGNHDLNAVEAVHVWLGGLPFAELTDRLREGGTRPPLYDWLLSLFLTVSRSEVWLRCLSVILSTGGVVLTYRAARRLFTQGTGIVAALLTAFSPILVFSAGSVVGPQALDFFLGALVVWSFIRLWARPGWAPVVQHGLALAAGAYGNPYLLTFLAVEGLFLLFHLGKTGRAGLRFLGAAGLALALFAPWMGATVEQLERRYGHDDLMTEALDLRLSCLFSELSLGRLHAWSPPTPVVSLLPSPGRGDSDPEQKPVRSGDRRPAGGSERGTEHELTWLQAVQMMFLGCLFMLAIVGAMAAMRLSARRLPAHLRVREVALKALRRKVDAARREGATEDEARGCFEMPLDTRAGAIYLLLALILPFLIAMGMGAILQWRFDSGDLVFLAVPLSMLTARGVGAFEWRVMFFGILALILAGDVVYLTLSRGYDDLGDGIEEAARHVERGFDSERGDLVVHESPLTWYPFDRYTEGHIRDACLTADAETAGLWGGRWIFDEARLPRRSLDDFTGRIWWIAVDPAEDSPFHGADERIEALRRAGLASSEIPLLDAGAAARSFGLRAMGVERFGNVTITILELPPDR